MLFIRPYKNSDKDAVIQLWHDCGLVVPWNDPATDISLKMNIQPDLFFVGLWTENLLPPAWRDTKGIAAGSIIWPCQRMSGVADLGG